MAALRRRAHATPDAIRRGPARLGTDLDDIAARVHEGEVVVLDTGGLDEARAAALVAAGVIAVVAVGRLASHDGAPAGVHGLLDAGVTVVDRTGPAVFARVGDGRELAVDPDTGEITDVDGRVIARGVVRSTEPDEVDDASTLARTAQLFRDAGQLVPDLPTVDDPGLVQVLEALDAARRPVAVVGRNACDTGQLRRWSRHSTPVVIATADGLATVRAAGLRVDVLVSRGPRPEGPEPSAVVSLPVDDVPDEVAALLIAGLSGSGVVTTWGVPVGRDELLAQPRESGAFHLAAILASGVTPLEGAALSGAGRGSLWPVVGVALSGALAGLSVLALSDPGLAELHRLVPGWHR